MHGDSDMLILQQFFAHKPQLILTTDNLTE